MVIETKHNKMQKSQAFCFSITLTTYQRLSSHMWLVVTERDQVDIEHFHYSKSYYWTDLFIPFMLVKSEIEKNGLPTLYLFLTMERNITGLYIFQAFAICQQHYA